MKNTIIVIILSIISNIVEYGHGQSNNCGLERFQCRSGQCITNTLLCDGRPDCNDQSDETNVECTKPEITCPDYAFRCAYGACVDGDAACNGVKDCIDNSDETLPRCSNKEYNISLCSENQFVCNNGQCIAGSKICDGTAECTDSSDETFAQCGSVVCQELFFRCHYGACIDRDLKCNGVVNCADGSDEDPRICSNVVTESPATTSPILTTSTTEWTPRPKQTCIAPLQPKNGFWELDKSHCVTEEQCNVQQGTQMELGTVLVYSCNSGYKIRGPSNVVCGRGGKWFSIPVCIEIHCKALDLGSTFAECYYNGERVSCQSPVLPGTQARSLKCRAGYRQDATLFPSSDVTCTQNGQWEPEPLRCIPGFKPTIVNGTQPNISEFPWHATLYKAEQSHGTKNFICGATIIRPNLLITAAHCVYNRNYRKAEEPSKFHVVTGNIYRDYDSPFHDLNIVKKVQVKNIYIVCSYQDAYGNYAEDMAILEIQESFKFSSLLLPVCLDLNDDRIRLDAGLYGKVAGFGRTAVGSSSYILQSVTLPYVSLTHCKSISQNYETEPFITHDKFCAGYTNGTAVCDGDSGGGLVFKKGDQWYLKGIVSLSLGTKDVGGSKVCNSDTYSLFTTVSKHKPWIEAVIFKIESKKSYFCEG
ncbi:coagulation factor X isoform X2 [Calliopsis andreniformis]|uniref:coagulation factor X isoform X2 n=1 Tax=Calliopsis andreniformis TaxID=337506 RepID=UPI003FCCF30B